MKPIAIIIASISLSGCVTTVGYWEKPGATQQVFAVDKFQCMATAQQQVSSSYVDQYGGSGSSYQNTNLPLFGAYMNARGYSWIVRKQET